MPTIDELAFVITGDFSVRIGAPSDDALTNCIDFLVPRLEACPNLPLSELIGIANQFLLGTNEESTVLALHVQSSPLLTAASDSPLYLVRKGRVEQMNEITKPRLGALQPGIKYLAFPLRRSDVIIGASDGFCLASYRLFNAVQRAILLPDSMPEAILQAQRDSTDDVTLVCAVI